MGSSRCIRVGSQAIGTCVSTSTAHNGYAALRGFAQRRPLRCSRVFRSRSSFQAVEGGPISARLIHQGGRKLASIPRLPFASNGGTRLSASAHTSPLGETPPTPPIG